MKVLVAGAAGFAGSGLVERLLHEGYDVKCLDIARRDEARNLRDVIDRVKYCWKSIHDVSKEDVEGYDIVCDFVAQADRPLGITSPEWTMYENIMGLTRLLEACKDAQLEKFIYPGSGTVFVGWHDGHEKCFPIKEDHPPIPSNPYSASKAMAETLCWSYMRCYGVPVVLLRNGIVYGERMRLDISIAQFLLKALRGRDIIVRSPQTTRDPTHVLDTLDAWMKVIEAPSDLVVGETFHVTKSEEYSMVEIAKKCVEVGGHCLKVRVGSTSRIIEGEYEPGEERMREWLDNTKARKVLGYEPRIDLETGLKLTADWLEEIL